MTKIIITDPSEAAPNGDGTWTGYWSVEIEEYGHIGDAGEGEEYAELVASINLAPSIGPNADSPEEVAEFCEELGEAFRALAEAGIEEGE